MSEPRPTELIPSPATEELAAVVARRRRREFAWTLAAVAVPATIGAFVLWTSLHKVRTATHDLEKKQAELLDLEATSLDLEVQRWGLEEDVGELARTLDETTEFSRNVYQFDWRGARATPSPGKTPHDVLVLMSLDQRHGLGWSFENTPEAGFDSFAYAVYLLRRMRVLQQDADLGALQHDPADAQPQPGDIVVFESYYALFYFRDNEGAEFVAGMTPAGITAIRLDGLKLKRTELIRTGLP